MITKRYSISALLPTMQTIFYNTFDIAFPPGAGIARFVTDCCKPFKIINKRLFYRLPLGGKLSAKRTDEGCSPFLIY